MTEERFCRTELLIGEEKLQKIQASHVAVFGVGGVGGYVAEALARAGVGELTLVDADRVCLSNVNRQILALSSTVGLLKVEVAKQRILDINPACRVHAKPLFFLPENAEEINFSSFDYVADCIDTVSGKIALVERSKEKNVPIICAAGAGNKLDPTLFRVADISETSVCPLARVMRTELKKRGIKGVKCVYSVEQAIAVKGEERKTVGSISFVPSVVGLLMASEILRDLMK